ncbi:MAG: AcrR family transcriptional regulator [Crocinitomicaceae bacterium]|jgi:AcrR family transcriptional regulator
MPKQTFLNLHSEKRHRIENAFYREFTIHKYDDASISSVLKVLGLAKGSFYQYFENKEDLFKYLMQHCFEIKMGYISHVKREDFETFWDFWRAMYSEGLQFDKECPLLSNFGYHLMENMNSPTIKPMYNALYQQGLAGMKTLIQPEINNGSFRKDIPPDRLAFYLMKTGEQLLQFMKFNHNEELELRIQKGESLFAGKNEKLFFELLDDNICLQSQAMNAKN